MDFAIIDKGIKNNPDGWGCSYIEDNGDIRTRHGFGFKGAKRAWIAGKGKQRVFHARVGTSGTKNIENTHPFDASTPQEPRVLFHNGTVDIPRFRSDMCDSWHLAQYIKQFQTDDNLMAAIQGYAKKERSRFVLVSPSGLKWFGDGWLERDGVYYSNSSCLGVTRGHAHGNACGPRHYSGGLMDTDELEITSPDRIHGFGYDTERNLWSNKVKETTSTHWQGLHEQREDGKIIASNRWFQGSVYDREKAMYVRDKADPTKGSTNGPSTTAGNGANNVLPLIKRAMKLDDKILAARAKDTPDHQRLAINTIAAIKAAPWMNNDWGEPGVSRSWDKDTDFCDVTHCYTTKNGHFTNVTYRVFTPKTKKWREVVYEDGVYKSNKFPAEGPYPDGLLITHGEEFVKIGGTVLLLPVWREVVLDKYIGEIFDRAAEADAEANDGLPFGEADSDEVSDAELLASLDGTLAGEAPEGEDAGFQEAHRVGSINGRTDILLKVNPETGAEYIQLVDRLA